MYKLQGDLTALKQEQKGKCDFTWSLLLAAASALSYLPCPQSISWVYKELLGRSSYVNSLHSHKSECNPWSTTEILWANIWVKTLWFSSKPLSSRMLWLHNWLTCTLIHQSQQWLCWQVAALHGLRQLSMVFHITYCPGLFNQRCQECF